MSDPSPASPPSQAKRWIASVVALVTSGLMLIPSVRNSAYAAYLRQMKIDALEILVEGEAGAKSWPGMASPANAIILGSGLEDVATRTTWHRTPEGSDVFPIALFRALTDPTNNNKPIIESFSRYGFIPMPEKGDGLPVGFSRVRSPNNDFALTGINCAACHSSAMTYHGKTLYIDGAPNQFDVEAFFRGMLGALKAGLEADGESKVKFVLRFALYNEQELSDMDKLEAQAGKGKKDHYHAPSIGRRYDHALEFLKARLESVKHIVESFDNGQTAAGPGRADSFGIIRNLMMTKDLVGAANFQPMTAPVSMPHLFGFGDFIWLHWDGNTNTGTDRNFAQAIALGASFDPITYACSVRPYDLYTLEKTARKLKAPKWPEIFGGLETGKVSRGETIFKEQCASCHTREGWHKLEVIKTDPNRLNNYAVPLNIKDGGKESYASGLYKSVNAVKTKSYADNKVPPATQKEMDSWHDQTPQWIETRDKGYFVRSLRGVWATAPYLHNGSVPSLWDLLQPQVKRPAKFAVGHREFDPKRVGYVEKPEQVVWELDTSLSGNHNTGHEYGTDLSEADKWNLIEYLKTL